MRVARTFAFVDLSGFTTFTDSHGDDDVNRVLAEFRATVRDTSSRRGVRVAKWLGDGAMFVAVEPQPLVEAVLEIECRVDSNGSPLLLKAGITSGQVLLFEGDDYVGSPVNLAARLCDSALSHEVLCTTELAEFVPPWATATDRGPVKVRGFAEQVPVLELHRRDAAGEAVRDPVCGMALPLDGIVAARTEPNGARLGFCSTTCASSWDDSQRNVVTA